MWYGNFAWLQPVSINDMLFGREAKPDWLHVFVARVGYIVRSRKKAFFRGKLVQSLGFFLDVPEKGR
jgi:hypothetical protein